MTEETTIAQQINNNIEKTLPLLPTGSWPASKHLLHKREAQAILTAFYTQRPLLAVGEPGVGKSQLARAAAELLNRHFIYHMIHPGADYQKLLWSFDHTERLGAAQLLAARHQHPTEKAEKEESTDPLAPMNFLSPGPLWWAINWSSAQSQRKAFGYQPLEPVRHTEKDRDSGKDRDPVKYGSVLLIDEIDKASVDLPNGLLESLENSGFSVPWMSEPVTCTDQKTRPFIVITSNNMRELPPAFLRRCVVLDMGLPSDPSELLIRLEQVGAIRFPDVDKKLRQEAARQIANDRQDQEEPPFAGQAEYLDLLQAISSLAKEGHDVESQKKLLTDMGAFVIDKVNRSLA